MDIKEIEEKHNRTVGGIESRYKGMDNNMYLNNAHLDNISDKAQLSIDVIEKIIIEKNNTIESLRIEIEELKNKIKELKKK